MKPTSTDSAPLGLFAGRSVLDIVQLIDGPPPVNGKTRSEELTIAAGGPATNAAILFAALGGSGQLVSRIGNDALGRAALEDIEASGQGRLTQVNIGGPDVPTAPSTININAATGDRSIVNPRPVEGTETGIDNLGFNHLIAGNAVVLIDSWETDTTIALAKASQALGIPVVWDCGAKKERSDLQVVHVDAALISEDYTGGDVEAAIAELRAAGVPYGAVTCGANPLHFYTPTTSGTITPKTVKAADTLAAGDFFHGAYAYAIARTGLTPEGHEAALRWACEVSALSIQYFGPRRWLAHLDRLPPAPSLG